MRVAALAGSHHITALYIYLEVIVAANQLYATGPKDLAPLVTHPLWKLLANILPSSVSALSNVSATVLIAYTTWCVQLICIKY
jgi:hypothetical protein